MPARKPNTSTAAKKDGEKAKRERKQYAPVSMDQLKPVKVDKIEKTKVLPGRERSEAQKLVDATTRDLAYEYLRDGSPKSFRDMPVVKYTVPPEQAETIRFMIGKACTYLNCKAKFGKPAEENGLEVVSFCAIPRDPAQWTDQPDNGDVTDPEPADTPEPKLTDPSEFADSDA